MKVKVILYDYQIFSIQRFGGISRYFCEIINNLDIKTEIGIQFTMNYYLNSWKSNHLIPIPRFVFKHYRSFFEKKNHLIIKRLLTQRKRYLFHPTYYNPYFLKYIGDNPYVITVHDMIHERFPQCFTDGEVIKKQKQEVITNATRIIAISENTKKDIIRFLNISPDKIDVIYHGTSMKPWTKKHTLKLPERYLLFVGDRTDYKNFDRFIKAFAMLHQKNKDLFVICTGRHFWESDQKRFTELGIQNHIIHIRASDKELSELYSRALLFVYPSLYEGFGIPLLEAFACHCPVALSNSSCFPEIVGDAGFFFDPYSETSILETLNEAIHNKHKRKQLIKAGDERLKKFSWEKAARETKRTYIKAYNEYKRSIEPNS